MSIDPRLIDRRRTIAEDNAKRNIGRLLKFLLFVVVMGSVVWLAFSPWLSVSMVTTSGIDISDGNAILAEERVVAGTPMIFISAPRVEAALVEDPWIAEASVELNWPDSVSVTVEERTPTAWVHTEGGWARRAIDGVALPSSSEPDDQMARIDMPDLADSEAHESGDLLGALEFVEISELDEGMVLTRFEDEIWASIPGYQVRLGRSVDMAEKARSLDALLKMNIPEGSTLVLIAPRNPSVMTPGRDDVGKTETESGESDEDGRH